MFTTWMEVGVGRRGKNTRAGDAWGQKAKFREVKDGVFKWVNARVYVVPCMMIRARSDTR